VGTPYLPQNRVPVSVGSEHDFRAASKSVVPQDPQLPWRGMELPQLGQLSDSSSVTAIHSYFSMVVLYLHFRRGEPRGSRPKATDFGHLATSSVGVMVQAAPL
jgi:hypothetical protein